MPPTKKGLSFLVLGVLTRANSACSDAFIPNRLPEGGLAHKCERQPLNVNLPVEAMKAPVIGIGTDQLDFALFSDPGNERCAMSACFAYHEPLSDEFTGNGV